MATSCYKVFPFFPPPHSAKAQKRHQVFLPLAPLEFRSTSSSLSSVICPSAAYAKTRCFTSGFNVQVIVDDNEPEERLLNRFRREVMRAGVVQECKRRRFFENKQEEKKRKAREAAKRNRRRRPFSSSSKNRQEAPATGGKKDDDDEDNWELPEGDAPL